VVEFQQLSANRLQSHPGPVSSFTILLAKHWGSQDFVKVVSSGFSMLNLLVLSREFSGMIHNNYHFYHPSNPSSNPTSNAQASFPTIPHGLQMVRNFHRDALEMCAGTVHFAPSPVRPVRVSSFCGEILFGKPTVRVRVP
jgi:hypothetical protein